MFDHQPRIMGYFFSFIIHHSLFIIRYSVAVALLLAGGSARAQGQKEAIRPYAHPHQVRANVGLSGIGLFSGLVRRVSGVANIGVTVQPAFQLNYAYRWRDRVSFGGGLSRQVFSARYRNYEYEGENGTTLLDNFTTYVRRFNVAGFARWHYNPHADRIVWYSGVRLGITRWTFDTNAQDVNYTVGQFLSFALGTQLAPQLILVGGDAYFTPHWGANFELGIGGPHLVSAGVGYRW